MKDAGSGTLGALLLALALLPQVDVDFKPPNSGWGKYNKYNKQSIGKKKNKCYFAFLLLIFTSSHPHKIPLLLLTRTLWCRCKTVLIIILTHNFLLYQITRNLGCRSYHHHHHHHHPTYKYDHQDSGVPFSVELSAKRSAMLDNRYLGQQSNKLSTHPVSLFYVMSLYFVIL